MCTPSGLKSVIAAARPRRSSSATSREMNARVLTDGYPRPVTRMHGTPPSSTHENRASLRRWKMVSFSTMTSRVDPGDVSSKRMREMASISPGIAKGSSRQSHMLCGVWMRRHPLTRPLEEQLIKISSRLSDKPSQSCLRVLQKQSWFGKRIFSSSLTR